MHTEQINKINRALGKGIDLAPIPLLYYDPADGTILKYNKRAEEVILATTGLKGMPETVFGDMDKLSFVAQRMRNHDEFEFFVTYDHVQKRFVPLTHIAGADPNEVLVAFNFKALDTDGEYLSNCVLLHALAESQKELLFSDVESAKNNTLTAAFGLAELTFHPRELTLDVTGGRDNYNIKEAPIEEVSRLIHPDDAEYFIDQFADAAVQYPDSIRFTARVFSIKLKTYRYFKLMFYPQIDSLGNVLSYGGFCIDVNEEEIAVRKKIDEVRQGMDRNPDPRGERNIISALANISHDLRNPLGIIMGLSDMMAQTDDHEKRAHYNKTIQSTAQRLLGMIAEIMNLNRLEFGNIELNASHFDLDSALNSFTGLYMLQFRTKGLKLEYVGTGTTVEMDTDLSRIHEILDNFMSNALKYTETGKVTVRCDLEGDDVCVHVIDTGRGISPEGCAKVFNRFEKLGTEIKGSGIGLHISWGLAKALGGSVGVTSQPGLGSDFWVRIPRRLPQEHVSTQL